MNVTENINISKPKGRKILQKLERNKVIDQIENTIPVGEDGLPEMTYSIEESFEKLWNKMEEHYGFDLRKL